jgi:hypothetical protein
MIHFNTKLSSEPDCKTPSAQYHDDDDDDDDDDMTIMSSSINKYNLLFFQLPAINQHVNFNLMLTLP